MLVEGLSPDIYWNKAFEKAHKEKDPGLEFLRNNLTWLGPNGRPGILETEAGISYDISSENYIARTSFSPQEQPAIRKIIDENLEQIAGTTKPSLPLYLQKGKEIIERLGFPYHEFTTGQVRAFIELSKKQNKTFPVTLSDLVIGNLGESALHELLIKNNKEFHGRLFLVYNSKKSQTEQDVTAYNLRGDELKIGVRSQRAFDTNRYSYSLKRIVRHRDKIGDYVVFFNNFGHHIFFITGIVQKDFLQINYGTKTAARNISITMPELLEPDSLLTEFGIPGLFDFHKQEVEAVLRKRKSFEDLMSRLKSP